jgi:hypothetical protein
MGRVGQYGRLKECLGIVPRPEKRFDADAYRGFDITAGKPLQAFTRGKLEQFPQNLVHLPPAVFAHGR